MKSHAARIALIRVDSARSNWTRYRFWMRKGVGARTTYSVLAVTTVVLGLAVHRGEFLGAASRDITADALWAMMVAWWIGAIAPAAPILTRGATALAIAFAVEFSQMYHATWIDGLRSNPLVHLVLGSDFDARDLLAYAAGALAAVAIEFALRRRLPQVFRP